MSRILLALVISVLALDVAAPAAQPPSPGGAVFVAYYWREKPGQVAAYNEYIRTVAEPIDESARSAGVFEEVRTVTPATGTIADWTHLRIFRRSCRSQE